MSKSDDIKAARDATAIGAVFQKIKESNTDHFNESIDTISYEDLLRTLILLTAEVKRLSDALALLQGAAPAATKQVSAAPLK